VVGSAENGDEVSEVGKDNIVVVYEISAEEKHGKSGREKI
jgi:hypothetical protein